MLTAYRAPFASRSELYVLSPEAVHGIALEYLTKRGDTTPLRIYGPCASTSRRSARACFPRARPTSSPTWSSTSPRRP
eukprot:12450467-Alexandrium_andersonii.AAC.1